MASAAPDVWGPALNPFSSATSVMGILRRGGGGGDASFEGLQLRHG